MCNCLKEKDLGKLQNTVRVIWEKAVIGDSTSGPPEGSMHSTTIF